MLSKNEVQNKVKNYRKTIAHTTPGIEIEKFYPPGQHQINKKLPIY